MMYYPDVSGNRNPTVCPPGEVGCDVQTVNPCTLTGPEATIHCGITVLDHYTSSFNFAQTNFSAIWLRKDGWYLFDHSFLSDVQSAGLSFVTGGDYTKSSAPTGFWMLASNSVFVGATQPQEGEKGYNPWADVRGPHIADNKDPTKSIGLACKRDPGHSRCIDADDGIGFFLDTWAANQRLFSIYDGPAYEDRNAFLNIKVSKCASGTAQDDTACMYKDVPGVRKYTNTGDGHTKGDAYLQTRPSDGSSPMGSSTRRRSSPRTCFSTRWIYATT